MALAQSFCSYNKIISDQLDKPYAKDNTFKLRFSGTTKDGVKLNTGAQAVASDKSKFTASFDASHECKDKGVAAKVSLQSSGALSVTGTFSKIADGLKLDVGANVNHKDKPKKGESSSPAPYNSADFGVSFANKMVATCLKLSVRQSDPKPSGCFGLTLVPPVAGERFSIGGCVQAKKLQFKGFNVGGVYKADDSLASLSANEKKDVSFAFQHKWCDDCSLVGRINYKNEPEDGDRALDFQVGFTGPVNDDTKAGLDFKLNEGTLGLSSSLKLSSNSDLSLAARVPILDAKPPTFTIGLSLHD